MKHYCALRDSEISLVFCIELQMAGATFELRLGEQSVVIEKANVQGNIYFLPISDAFIDSFLQRSM